MLKSTERDHSSVYVPSVIDGLSSTLFGTILLQRHLIRNFLCNFCIFCQPEPENPYNPEKQIFHINGSFQTTPKEIDTAFRLYYTGKKETIKYPFNPFNSHLENLV